MNRLVLLPLFLLCLLLPSQVFATQFIPYTGITQPNNPTICILYNNGGVDGFNMTKSIVNSWADKLNHLTFSHNWNMTLKTVDRMHKTDCNILFNYDLEPHPFGDIYVPDTGQKMIGATMAVTTCDDETYGHVYCEINMHLLNLNKETIYTTAQHEFGHSLGLGHRQGDNEKDKMRAFVSDDLMYAIAKKFSHLTNEDALAIIHLYGAYGFHVIHYKDIPDQYNIDYSVSVKEYCNGINGTICYRHF